MPQPSASAETLAVAADTTLTVATAAGAAWVADWPLAAFSAAACETLLTRRMLQQSSAMLLSDAIQRQTRIGLQAAGNHGAWDVPYLIGPGIDRLSLWFDGLSSAGAAIPEALLHTLSPLLLENVLLVAPDPFLDPLAEGQDALLWCEARHLSAEPSPSAVRLTEGPGGSNTEDVIMGRHATAYDLLASYAHSRSEGRPLAIQPRYAGSSFQNLALRLARRSAIGPLALQAGDRSGRSGLAPDRKLVWEARQLTLGWQPTQAGQPVGELLLTRRNDLLQWWGDRGHDRRRTTSTEARLRLQRAVGRWTLLCAAGAEALDVRLDRLGVRRVAEQRFGTGVAIGAKREAQGCVLLATLGAVDPWWGPAHARGHLLAGAPLTHVWSAAVEAWSNAQAAFTPRLEGDGEALLEEGLLLTDLSSADDGPLRRCAQAEAHLRGVWTGQCARAGFFLRDLRHAVGSDPALAEDLVPGVRDTLRFADVAGAVKLAGVNGSLDLRLPGGIGISGDGERLVSPAEQDLPVLVPAYRGRGVLSLRGRFFHRQLKWELRGVALFCGGYQTFYGEVREQARYDVELHGTVGRAHFFLAWRNLANERQESATYADGAWMPLPYRSSQAGIEWSFSN